MAAPIANFSWTISNLSVSFTDTSTNTPVSWLWEFGDSTTSNVQNPTHLYAFTGTYTVRLTVTNADGTNSLQQSVLVIPPVAQYGFSPSGLSVSFTDTSLNNPTNWLWDFGDSNTSNIQNPTHTYSVPGTYTVKLTVSSPNGTSNFQRQINVSTSPVLPLSLRDFTLAKIGSIPIDSEVVDAYIAQWQLYIGPLVLPPINELDYLNELAYTPLANALIASLAAWSSITQAAQSLALAGSNNNTAGGGGNSQTTQTGGSSGGLKAIETGPSRVEWYDNSEMVRNIFSTRGSSVSSSGGLMSPFFQTYLNEICGLAARLGIQLPMCPVIYTPVIHHRVVKKNHVPGNILYCSPILNWDAYPNQFTIF